MEAGLSSGTPALKVKGKLLARLWEDGETLVLKVDKDAQLRALLEDSWRFTAPKKLAREIE